MHDVGYAHAARLREPLQARGNVHAIAENVPFVENHVTDIDPDAIDDSAVHRARAFARRHSGLYVDRAPHRVLGGRKLRQHPVASGLDDASATARDPGIDQLAPVHLVALENARLILLHEPAVARHVGDKDGRESSLHWPTPMGENLAEHRRQIHGAR